MLRKLGAYPRQNGLALALRELGRLERSLFTLQYLKDIELRLRIDAGLNKGEARNALGRAVFFNRLGNSVTGRMTTSAIARAGRISSSRRSCSGTRSHGRRGQGVARAWRGDPDDLVAHLSPLGWNTST